MDLRQCLDLLCIEANFSYQYFYFNPCDSYQLGHEKNKVMKTCINIRFVCTSNVLKTRDYLVEGKGQKLPLLAQVRGNSLIGTVDKNSHLIG